MSEKMVEDQEVGRCPSGRSGGPSDPSQQAVSAVPAPAANAGEPFSAEATHPGARLNVLARKLSAAAQEGNAFKCSGCGTHYRNLDVMCDCPTGCLFRANGRLLEHANKPDDGDAELARDYAYLEQASAHADEGPLGEPAARSLLTISQRLAARLERTLAEQVSA